MISTAAQPIIVRIPGEAAPGGSKSAYAARYGHGDSDRPLVIRGFNTPPRRDSKDLWDRLCGVPVITVSDAGVGNANWKKKVAQYAKQQYKGAPLDEPINVEFRFAIERPAFHFGKRGLLASAPVDVDVTPDVTKLVRSTEDALSGILWANDKFIIRQVSEKVYVNDVRNAMVTVTVTRRRAQQQAALEFGRLQ